MCRRQPRPGAGPPLDRRQLMDFGDSTAEAEFRQRLRAWLATNNPGLPGSSTDDEYWAGMAAWHQSLFAGGFFGLSWPVANGVLGLPTVYDVLLDDELAEAGAPPRPILNDIVQWVLEQANQDSTATALPVLGHAQYP